MGRLACYFLMCLTAVPANSQVPTNKYEVGTITAVARHVGVPETEESSQYDVSVRIRDTVYVALYTAPPGMRSVEYAAGRDGLFRVQENTLRYSNKQGGWTDMPILRKEAVLSGPIIDWSKAPGRYYEMKMDNLSSRLNLTEEQKVKIKPIIQQERGEVGSVCFTSIVPRKERLKSFEKIVRSSDNKLKSILTDQQWQQLEALRKEQQQELKTFLESDSHR